MPPRRGRPPMGRPVAEMANEILENASEIPEFKAPARPEMREEDPRARAAKRAAELRENRDESYDGTDEFYIDQSVIPTGWSYEWKRRFVMNQEDISHTMALKRSGWEEVPTSRHPEMMSVGSQEEFIMRKGQVLMERPLEITQEARLKDHRAAREAILGKEQQLNSVASQFDNTRVKIGKGKYDAIRIPE